MRFKYDQETRDRADWVFQERRREAPDDRSCGHEPSQQRGWPLCAPEPTPLGLRQGANKTHNSSNARVKVLLLRRARGKLVEFSLATTVYGSGWRAES